MANDLDQRRLSLAGSRVHVVDPIPLHVEQVTDVDPRISAEVGDAITPPGRPSRRRRPPPRAPLPLATVADAVATCVFCGADAGLFTNAYFHRPQELADEVRDAGFTEPRLYNIEGPGFVVPDFEARWQDPARREAMMKAARLVESDADMLAAAGHLLAVADRDGAG